MLNLIKTHLWTISEASETMSSTLLSLGENKELYEDKTHGRNGSFRSQIKKCVDMYTTLQILNDRVNKTLSILSERKEDEKKKRETTPTYWVIKDLVKIDLLILDQCCYNIDDAFKRLENEIQDEQQWDPEFILYLKKCFDLRRAMSLLSWRILDALKTRNQQTHQNENV